jgi:glycosyltransferase involved in cell wall biosynthesis
MNVLGRGLDRVAFGTQGSLDMYATYVRRDRLARVSALIEALPAPCSCTPPARARDGGRLLFLGAFDERKGIRQLMAAWDAVPPDAPAHHLRLIGKGPLLEEVTAWAGSRSNVSLVIDPPRSIIHEELWQATALILLSQRTPSFREQVGLPIVEGLAHGCRIVASSETGIATWLASHGHVVVEPDARPAAHAAAIVQAFESHRSADDVLADLPHVDGRLEADRWMFAPLS